RNDLALVALPATVQLAPIRPADAVDVAAEGIYVPGTPHLVTGWGSTAPGDKGGVDQLRGAVVPAIGDADCASSYAAMHPASMVCAGYPWGGIDSCQGDSGGPLWRSSGN